MRCQKGAVATQTFWTKIQMSSQNRKYYLIKLCNKIPSFSKPCVWTDFEFRSCKIKGPQEYDFSPTKKGSSLVSRATISFHILTLLKMTKMERIFKLQVPKTRTSTLISQGVHNLGNAFHGCLQIALLLLLKLKTSVRTHIVRPLKSSRWMPIFTLRVLCKNTHSFQQRPFFEKKSEEKN